MPYTLYPNSSFILSNHSNIPMRFGVINNKNRLADILLIVAF